MRLTGIQVVAGDGVYANRQTETRLVMRKLSCCELLQGPWRCGYRKNRSKATGKYGTVLWGSRPEQRSYEWTEFQEVNDAVAYCYITVSGLCHWHCLSCQCSSTQSLTDFKSFEKAAGHSGLLTFLSRNETHLQRREEWQAWECTEIRQLNLQY